MIKIYHYFLKIMFFCGFEFNLCYSNKKGGVRSESTKLYNKIRDVFCSFGNFLVPYGDGRCYRQFIRGYNTGFGFCLDASGCL